MLTLLWKIFQNHYCCRGKCNKDKKGTKVLDKQNLGIHDYPGLHKTMLFISLYSSFINKPKTGALLYIGILISSKGDNSKTTLRNSKLNSACEFSLFVSHFNKSSARIYEN